MFSIFFGVKSRTKVVEVDGGKFEFKLLSKDTPIRVLWFTKYDIAQSTVADDRSAHIAPFRENGVACEKRLPGGRNVELFFFEHGDLWCEKGFILDEEHFVYMHRNEMRLLTKYHNDVVIFDKKTLRCLGYDGYIHFDEEMFYFRSNRSELVPFDYYDYKGNPLTVYKNERIAREIMLQIRMFVTKEFAKNHLDINRGQELAVLTWDAKTATIENVKLLLTLEKEENNLEDLNASRIYSIIECFETENLRDKFTRYMELFFTAYEQISMHEDWTKSQWFGKNNLIKELDEHHNDVYQKMHTSMDLLTKILIARTDFLELLEDYPSFEKAVRAFIGMEEKI